MASPIELNLPPLDGCKVAIALSGGRDSVALAHALKAGGVDIFAVNVEHGIRGAASIADSEFVARWCAREGIELKSFSVSAPEYAKKRGLTLEQAARELRYSVFNGLLEGGECDYVALAHHRDDQSETLLMRIFRGTGLRGLRGMKPVSGRFLRPLLGCSRADIDEYVSVNGLEYVDDESNDDTAYTRNFLRKELREIKKRYPSLDEALLRLSRAAAEAEDFIDGFVPEPEISGAEAAVFISDMAEPVVAKRLILKACRALGVDQDIEERHQRLLIELCRAENGKRAELPHGLTAHKENLKLVFTRGTVSSAQTLPVAFPKGFYGSAGGIVIQRVERAERDGALYADADRIPDGAVLRRRKPGDTIEKFGGGTKSLGDFLTDRKVPLRTRDRIVVCAVGSRVLFAAGVEISEEVKVRQSTKNIIRITTEDENVR